MKLDIPVYRCCYDNTLRKRLTGSWNLLTKSVQDGVNRFTVYFFQNNQCSALTSLVSTFAHETREIAHETSFLLLLTKRVSRNEFFAPAHETSSHETTFFALLAKRVLRKRDISSAFETNYQPKYNDTNVLDTANFCDTFGLGVAHRAKFYLSQKI